VTKLTRILIVASICSLACRPSISTQIVQPQSERKLEAQSVSDEFEANRSSLPLPLVRPRIVVIKSSRRLSLYSGGELVRRYRIALGSSPIDDKAEEGDRRTPEGEFYIFVKNEKSSYYLSLGLSYPNIEDADRGLKDGLIDQAQHDEIVNAIRNKTAPPQNTALGGEIYIHGNGVQSDWTWGCVALENNDMRELFDAVPVGTEVIIEH